MSRDPIRARFAQQRCAARQRKIRFELTFRQWLNIWTKSGHLEERGCHRGQYVMARINDVGPYAVWNVKIVRQDINHAEGPPPPHSQGSRNPASKLTEQQVKIIRIQATTQSNAALARKYGVSTPVIRSIVNRLTWTHI